MLMSLILYGHCFDAFIIDYISTKFDPKSCMLNIILYIAIFFIQKGVCCF